MSVPEARQPACRHRGRGFPEKGVSFGTFCTGRGLSEGYFENEAAGEYEGLEILSLTGHSPRVASLIEKWTSLYRVT